MRTYNTRSNNTDPHWERFDLTWIHPIYGEIQQRGLIQTNIRFFARQHDTVAWQGPFEKRKKAEEFLESLYQPLVGSKVSQ
jgi:hypothetical protein